MGEADTTGGHGEELTGFHAFLAMAPIMAWAVVGLVVAVVWIAQDPGAAFQIGWALIFPIPAVLFILLGAGLAGLVAALPTAVVASVVGLVLYRDARSPWRTLNGFFGETGPDRLLSIEQAAEIAQLPFEEVRQAAWDTKLKTRHRAGSWVVVQRDLDAWLEKRNGELPG